MTQGTCFRTAGAGATCPESEPGLTFQELPPFPTNIDTAPLLRIKLSKLLSGDEAETDRLWQACQDLGFFYLQLNDDGEGREDEVLAVEGKANSDDVLDNAHVNGEQLLRDAEALFKVGEQFFELPIPEKVKYDYLTAGGGSSYFGYKGYGAGVIDKLGTRDRNEFYNVSKDDIMGLSDPLPAPDLLKPHRTLMKSYMKHSHAIVIFLLNILNTRLGLAPGTLAQLHRLQAASGDQLRWVCSPPQPFDDRKTALGEHTDFGSVTVLFNRLGGLQVLPPGEDKTWRYVKPLKGHAVVNLGDAMVKFTAGVLRSNIHRVVSPPGEQADRTRMSLVYFSRPEDDVVLKVLSSELIDERRKGKVEFKGEETVTAKEWVLRRALARRTGGDFEKSMGTDEGRL